MTAVDGLLERCEAEPDQAELFLIAADAIQDEGSHWLGEAYRWCGTNSKRPGKTIGGVWFWSWEDYMYSMFDQAGDCCRLPRRLREDRYPFSVFFPNFRKAMQYLARRLEKE